MVEAAGKFTGFTTISADTYPLSKIKGDLGISDLKSDILVNNFSYCFYGNRPNKLVGL